MPDLSPALIQQLIIPAVLISIIGFVESISIAQTLAAKKRQRIDPNQALIGLAATTAAAAAASIIAALSFGVSAGIILSLSLFLFKTSRPHVAEVGLVPGTEHFRNINRHAVLKDPTLVTLRVDEGLYFANARFQSMGVGFHLSEVKGPVMDRLLKTDFLTHLNGQVFLTQFQAWEALRPQAKP